MKRIRTDLSFIATIKSQIEGLEGFLDIHTAWSDLPGVLLPATGLTVNNYYNFPEVDPSLRCSFHFRCLELPDAKFVYNIVANVHGEELQCVSTTMDGTVMFQPTAPDRQPELWHLKSAAGPVTPDSSGKYSGVWLERYYSAAEQAWRESVGADWRLGIGFYALSKRDSGRYWTAGFATLSGAERTPFIGDLYVSHIGFYDVKTLEQVMLEELEPEHQSRESSED